jgi:flagellar protein FliS
MGDGQVELAHRKLRRTEDILLHLREVLDMEQGGEIATRLQSIYVFCQSYLLKARLDRDPAKIDRVSAMLGELRDAWATIEQQR